MTLDQAKQIGKAVQLGLMNLYDQPELQAAFNRLHDPRLIYDYDAAQYRALLWQTNQVNLDTLSY